MASLNRRKFLASAAAFGALALTRRSLAATSRSPERLRIGLIGCGGRGTRATAQALRADPGVELHAIADLFDDQLAAFAQNLTARLAEEAQNYPDLTPAELDSTLKHRVTLAPERVFHGWDACRQLCALTEIDIVLIATPPVFHPLHLEIALHANKHVFLEKPACVDPVGARKMLELSALADAKKLSVVGGTQRRHQNSYREGMKRIHEGQIGDLVAGQCYWLQGLYGGAELRHPELDTDSMEYQLRNWPLFIWTSGDHIVEQHVHNIDVITWAFGRPPLLATAQGGRNVDLPMPRYGNRFTHFATDFDFGHGAHIVSLCRQEPGTYGNISERLIGTKGIIDFRGSQTTIVGEKSWSYTGPANNAYIQEHIDLIASVRDGRQINDIVAMTTSTLTAILGRESAYTGRSIKYDWIQQNSKLTHAPADWTFGPQPIAPLPLPGKTELV